jgi:hypothetical protein
MAAKFLAQAFQGNYTMLARYIPKLKDVTSKQKAWNMILDWTTDGLVLAKKRTGDFEGAFELLRNQFDDASMHLAIGLLPNMTKFIKWLTKLTERFTDLSPGKQKAVAVGAGAAAASFPIMTMIGNLLQIGIFARLGKLLAAGGGGAGGGGLLAGLLGLGKGLIMLGGPVGAVIKGGLIGTLSAMSGMKAAREGKIRPWNPLAVPGYEIEKWANEQRGGGLAAPTQKELADLHRQQIHHTRRIERHLRHGVPVKA